MPHYVLWIFFLAMMKARGELPFIPENNAAMMVNWNAVEENKKLYAIYDTRWNVAHDPALCIMSLTETVSDPSALGED